MLSMEERQMEMDMSRELQDSLKLSGSRTEDRSLDQEMGDMAHNGVYKRKRPMRGLRTKARKRNSYTDY